MDAFYRWLEKLGLRSQGPPRQYQLDQQVHELIGQLARQAQLPAQEITTGLLSAFLLERDASLELVLRWLSLSPRQQQVAALTCLGYTNREIAARLAVAPSTIKTHIKNILFKFNLHGKPELILALQDWDFSKWERTSWRARSQEADP